MSYYKTMYPVYGAHHLRKQVKKKKERKTTKKQINKQQPVKSKA